MSIPMPGHPVPSNNEHKVPEDCKRLQDLIDSHDAVFLLIDTRESRWLPTLLCSNANKITITAALGFDCFLIMRHGAGPLSNSRAHFMGDLSAEVGNSSFADERPRLVNFQRPYFRSAMHSYTSSTCSYSICPCSRTSSWNFTSSA